MHNIKYNIVIRTLGTGGEKYRALLNSIQKQSLKPTHVYVITADGYTLPTEQLGFEEFVYTRKGMWHQRVFSLQYAAGEKMLSTFSQ